MSHSETITRNDLTNILNEVIPSTSVNYVVETHIEPLTIATNAYTETTFTATKSGYFPLGIVGYRIGWVSGETGKCNVYSLKMTNKSEGSVTVAYAVYNVTSASVSMNLQVDILWAKVDGASASFQTDYIVEQGTSGIWTYRKWNSGVAECWGIYESAITGSTSWGSVYYTTIKTVSFPTSLFVERPSCSITSIGSNIQGWGTSNRCTKDEIDVFLMRPTNASDGAPTLSLHAIGRWK